MVYTKDEFLNYLKDNQYKVFVCFDGLLNEKNITDKMPLEQHVAKDSNFETCFSKIENILNRKPGRFTFLLQDKYSNRSQMMRAQVDTYTPLNVIDKSYVQIDQDENKTIFDQLTPEEISKRIDEQVNLRLAAQELKRQEEAQKKELEDLKTNGGKLAFVLSELIKNLGLSPANLQSSVMNGFNTQTTPGAPQGAQPGTQTEYTPTQQANLEKAFGILLNKLGYETVLNLAKKVHDGHADSVLPMIINFANMQTINK